MQLPSKVQSRKLGGEIHNELWVSSEELKEFSKHVAGKIEASVTYFRYPNLTTILGLLLTLELFTPLIVVFP